MSTDRRLRGGTEIFWFSAGESLNKLNEAVIATSPGFAKTTVAPSRPSPAAAPGQNQEVLIRLPETACGNPLSVTKAEAAPSGAAPPCLSIAMTPAPAATMSTVPRMRRTMFTMHHLRSRQLLAHWPPLHVRVVNASTRTDDGTLQ